MIIRKETPFDAPIIADLTARAFADVPYSDGSEPRIIDALRADGDLRLSLIAEVEGAIAGQITFSPVTIDLVERGWMGLGPVSVDPARQKQGIGSALIIEGLSQIKTLGAEGCVLVGDPAYYSRFGFKGDSGLQYGELDPAFVQQLPFDGKLRSGRVEYASGFSA